MTQQVSVMPGGAPSFNPDGKNKKLSNVRNN